MKKTPGALVPLRRRPNSTPEVRDNDSETVATDGHDGDDSVRVDEEDGVDDQGPITGKMYTQQQYWNYVDDYLEYIRTTLFTDIMDRSERQSQMLQCVLILVLVSFTLLITLLGCSMKHCRSTCTITGMAAEDPLKASNSWGGRRSSIAARAGDTWSQA